MSFEMSVECVKKISHMHVQNKCIQAVRVREFNSSWSLAWRIRGFRGWRFRWLFLSWNNW
jgi:hypothetical protein